MNADVLTAWSAGLFEGEGSIEIRSGSHGGVSLVLNTTDLDVLEKFVEVVGCGKTREVTAPSIVKPHWKTCWSWKISRNSECERLLSLWLPHLGARRGNRAREALELLEEKESARWRTCHCGKHFRSCRATDQQWACSAECRTAWQKEMAIA